MNWGIIGYGEIAPSFIEGLEAAKVGRLAGIASISSYEFLKRKELYEDIIVFQKYSDLIESSNIDILYVSTTNNLHFENAKAVLNSGKHLLCEKPLTPSPKQTGELIDIAKENNVFFMEGMWTRLIPSYRKFIEILNSGEIGKPKLLKADFGFLNNWPKSRRLLNPDLFGGTLLDNADYNIFLSQDVFREFPIEISAQATFADTGVEDACSILLKYPSGGMAQLYSSFRCKTKQEAIIYGEDGFIELKEYWHGTEIVLNKGKTVDSQEYLHKANGFEYQIEAVEESIAKGELENKVIPHHTSLEVALIIEEISTIIGRNR